MPQRMTALGLDANWVVKFAGSADALWAELAAAEKEGSALASLSPSSPGWMICEYWLLATIVSNMVGLTTEEGAIWNLIF